MNTFTENTATSDVRQNGVELAKNVTLRLQHNDTHDDTDLFITYYGDVLVHFIIKGEVEVEHLNASLLNNQGRSPVVDRIEDRH